MVNERGIGFCLILKVEGLNCGIYEKDFYWCGVRDLYST